MVNIEPHIEVYDVQKTKQSTYGNAGKVALVGAFPTSTFQIDIFTDLDEAQNALVGEYKTPRDNSVANANKDVVPTSFVSFYCLEYIFNSTYQSRGAESVLVINTNYGAQTLATNSTNQAIADALVLLAEEEFDILTLAESISLAVADDETYILNPVMGTLKSFVDSQFLKQKPFGIITGFDLTNATTALITQFKSLFADKGIYKAIVTPVRLNGDAEALNIAQSGCWHSAFTAGRAVNKTETAKVYDGVIGLNSKEVYPLTAAVTWKNLLNNGFHTTKYKNRRLGTVQCLSNVTPCDYDMKIERVKNYMIKRLALEDILGEDNNKLTRDLVKALFEYEKSLAIRNNYLVDMEYSIVSVATDKIKANLKLYIPDVIRVIELDVSVEISAYEGE